MRLQMGFREHDRTGLPRLRLKNMMVERTPASETEVTLLSRPGMAVSNSPGSGPINGVFVQDGTFSGNVFSISSTTLYRNTTSIGTVTGTGVASFAGSDTELITTRGSSIHHYDGTTLSTVTFPSSYTVRKVLLLAGYFIAIRNHGAGEFYWSALLDGTDWDSLDFANAESAPDGIRDALVIGDELWFFGEDTIETWAPTGVSAAPFARVQARLYRKGVIQLGCAVEIDNAPFWVGDDAVVYRAGDVPTRISDHAIEQAVRESTASDLKLFGFDFNGHSMIILQTTNTTFAYDVASGLWSVWGSGTSEKWRVGSAARRDRSVYLGDTTLGKVWVLTQVALDEDGTDFDKIWRAYAPLRHDAHIDNLTVDCNVGETPVSSGDGDDPIIYMRFSQDNGNTFTAEDSSETLGVETEYRAFPEWRRLGKHESPGSIFEFRVDAPVPVRCSGVYINERPGGLSRAA